MVIIKTTRSRFILLQTIYNNYDQLARRRRVFKVVTIGDCYLAVTGLPDPQVNHAMIMARFSYECRQKMRELEVCLFFKSISFDFTICFITRESNFITETHEYYLQHVL